MSTHSYLSTHVKITRFEWDERTQGHILGAYYYGYILTNILGGRLAERVGSRLVVLLGMLLSSVLSLVSPLAAHLSTGVFIGVRLVQGVAQVRMLRVKVAASQGARKRARAKNFNTL